MILQTSYKLILEKKEVFSIFTIFFIILLYPLFGLYLDKIVSVSGVSNSVNRPEFTMQGIADGSFQRSVDEYLLSEMPGKSFMVKVNNQLKYSLFKVSPNNNVVIGKDNQLFEPGYLVYSLITAPPKDEEILSIVQKLDNLQKLLETKRKELYVFITPAKSRYYEQYAPFYYELCKDTNPDRELAYDKFVRLTKDTDLNVFDSIEFINNMESFDFPLWYTTGTHWSRVLGATVAEGFNEYLIEQSRYNLGQIQVSYKPVDKPVGPDADLFNTLNLFSSAKESYYDVDITVKEGTETPNIFIRGGSFMGQSLSFLIRSKIFDKDIHFENSYYYTDRYTSGAQYISAYTAYDELDVIGFLDKSDILVLEVNETVIKNMSWEFIEYILENYK